MQAARDAGAETVSLVVVAGLVASGKSSVARELAARLGFTCIEADRVRDQLLQHARAEPREAPGWETFAPDFVAQVYRELVARAERALAEGRSVVLDACFASAEQRRLALAVARRRGVPFLFAECRASTDVVRARLAARDRSAPRKGWRAIHDALAARWEPADELARDEHVVVSTDAGVAEAVAALESHVRARRRVRGPETGAPRPAVVTFDCWNTLLFEADWQIAHARRVTELQAAARGSGVAVSYDEANKAFEAAWERQQERWREGRAAGAHDVARWGLELLGLVEPHPALEELVHCFEEASHSSRVSALEGARETLARCARAGIACALICDTGLTPGRIVRRHLDRHGLLDGLAVVIFSDEVGVPKPDPRVFRAALGPLGVPPERALHVGDLRRTDVAGARGIGMSSARIRDQHDDTSELPEADFVVADHAELRALLALKE
jgi:putative hydrolase of the HAD superfamily